MAQKQKIPKPIRHPSGQARVRIRGRDFYCGKWGTPEADARYEQLIKEHVLDQFTRVTAKSVTSILAAYWPYCKRRYSRGKGPLGGAVCYRPTIRLLSGRRQHFGDRPGSFGHADHSRPRR